MADDPRRAVIAHWRQETGAAPAPSAGPTQLRTRRATPSYPLHHPHPPPPSASSASSATAAGSAAPFGSARARHGYASDERKGADDPLARKPPTENDPYSHRQRQPSHPPPPRRVAGTTSTASAAARQAEREKQRDLHMQLARMMGDTQRGSSAATPASSGAVYYELESPARPAENGGGYLGNQADAYHDNRDEDEDTSRAYGRTTAAAPPPPTRTTRTARRVSPSDVMQELDDDFRRSFNEHQHASETLSRDAAHRSAESQDNDDDEDDDGEEEENRDTFDGRPNGTRGAYSAPPPVVEVRVQHVHPPFPFREELSSDLSDHAHSAARTPSHSQDADGNATSDDLGMHFPLSGEFDSIPSISLTPPASPAHHQPRNANTTAATASQSSQRHAAYPDERRGGVVSQKEVVFPTWSIGFLAGCVVVGLGGIFMEELMEYAGVFIKPSPFTLSRNEQRDMNRRLDLLQQELRSFRVAATEIEQQSQRMVHEVRAHLDKMKSERERHQQMISREMEALRRYVQAVTTELVEDEKKEIRKRLLETIADTIVELPDDLDEDNSVVGSENKKSRLDASRPTSTEAEPPAGASDGGRTTTHDKVEIAISAAESEAAHFKQVDEVQVMHQIDQAVASGLEVAHSVTGKNSTAIGAGQVDTETSLFSFELLALLTGVTVIAGIVGFRVRNSHRRKIISRNRKPPILMPRFGARKNAPVSTDESDVETVSFFRSEDGDDTDYRSTGPSDGEAFSEDYSEEEKEGDTGNEYESTGGYEESMSAYSDRDDFDFQPAESGGDMSTHSDVESLDESPSTSVDPPTPYPRMTQQLKERLADESPVVRRSPRVQTARSQLSHMR